MRLYLSKPRTWKTVGILFQYVLNPCLLKHYQATYQIHVHLGQEQVTVTENLFQNVSLQCLGQSSRSLATFKVIGGHLKFQFPDKQLFNLTVKMSLKNLKDGASNNVGDFDLLIRSKAVTLDYLNSILHSILHR